MLAPKLCDYSDVHILVKRTITIVRVTDAEPNNGNKKVMFKHCTPFTRCISRINDTQVYDAHYNDVVMPIFNLIENSDNYSETSGTS